MFSKNSIRGQAVPMNFLWARQGQARLITFISGAVKIGWDGQYILYMGQAVTDPKKISGHADFEKREYRMLIKKRINVEIFLFAG